MMENAKNESVPWHTSPSLWRKLKPEARRMRKNPTPSEELLWERLRRGKALGFRFRRQHTVGRFIVDFYCATARLIVEVDGSVHDALQEEDAIRDEFLKNQGFRVLRFTNDHADGNVGNVLQRIKETLIDRNETS